MAVVDVAKKTLTLKIVYYGCALGGKTTNLISLHHLTDPDNSDGLVSIATKNDRTLFFDLLPMELGQCLGLQVKAKIYTVPGQVHFELTRRQVLAGADGVIQVVDSNPETRKANQWAIDNLRLNLEAGGLDPDSIPIVLQWNKRDLPNARPVEEMEREMNGRHWPAYEAVATTGRGVVETFAAILKLALAATHAKTGRGPSPQETIDQTIDKALEEARAREPKPTQSESLDFDHRFDMEAHRDRQAEFGHDRRIVDEAPLLSEAVATNTKLAEQPDDSKDARALSERHKGMMAALGRLAPLLADPTSEALPSGVMARLIEGAGRRQGSLMLLVSQTRQMQEREIVPGGKDPLNQSVAPGGGSAAYRLCQGGEPRLVEDLQTEVFFDAVPPGAEGLAGALIAPLTCDAVLFGALIVYSRVAENGFDSAEQEYWTTAATLIGLSLNWRALRKKLSEARAS